MIGFSSLLIFALLSTPVMKTTLKGCDSGTRKLCLGQGFQALRERSGRGLQRKHRPEDLNGGVRGDEELVVRKMKSGQLDGAAVTAVGLSKIVPNALVLQLPGLFDSYKELDYVSEEDER